MEHDQEHDDDGDQDLLLQRGVQRSQRLVDEAGPIVNDIERNATTGNSTVSILGKFSQSL